MVTSAWLYFWTLFSVLCACLLSCVNFMLCSSLWFSCITWGQEWWKSQRKRANKATSSQQLARRLPRFPSQNPGGAEWPLQVLQIKEQQKEADNTVNLSPYEHPADTGKVRQPAAVPDTVSARSLQPLLEWWLFPALLPGSLPPSTSEASLFLDRFFILPHA